jgi:hypothetical protein
MFIWSLIDEIHACLQEDISACNSRWRFRRVICLLFRCHHYIRYVLVNIKLTCMARLLIAFQNQEYNPACSVACSVSGRVCGPNPESQSKLDLVSWVEESLFSTPRPWIKNREAFQANEGVLPWIGCGHFIPEPVQFIIHPSPYRSTQ